MVHLFPGSLDQYFAYVNDCNNRDRQDREARARAETDPAQQCNHGVSLYKTCRECCAESTVTSGELWHDVMAGRQCGTCGYVKPDAS